MKKKKIFIDTDICDDIDDLWALILALNIDELEIIGLSVSQGNTVDKARFVCKILSDLGYTFPVYIGRETNQDQNNHLEYIDDYKLSNYPGEVYGGFSNIETLFKNEKDITIVALGPLTNIADMYSLYPEISSSRLVVMGGAFYKGYINQDSVTEEYNVLMDINAFRKVTKSFRRMTIAPLDVCRDIVIDGKDYELIMTSNKDSLKLLIKNYEIWERKYSGGAIKYNYKFSSTILYDVIPILYLIEPSIFFTKKLNFNILDNGVTEVNMNGKFRANILTYISNEELLYQNLNQYLLKEHEIDKKKK